MARHKDMNWSLPEGTPSRTGGASHIYESIHAALLMDIRDALKEQNDLTMRLVNVLECRNTFEIPHILKRIEKRLAKAIPLK